MNNAICGTPYGLPEKIIIEEVHYAESEETKAWFQKMKRKWEKKGQRVCMNKFKKGDKVQLTLETAVKLEMMNVPKKRGELSTPLNGVLNDPLNEVFEVLGTAGVSDLHGYTFEGDVNIIPPLHKPDDKYRYFLKSKTGAVCFGVSEENMIKVEGEPRHIDKIIEKRPSKDEYYLSIAKQVASQSTCLRRKYGAVIVRNDVIISTGYNGSPRGERNCSDRGYCLRQIMGAKHNDGNYDLCRSVHAEQNAIINAARQGSSIFGATLYLYGYDCGEKKTINAESCPICARMIENAGIVDTVSSKER